MKLFEKELLGTAGTGFYMWFLSPNPWCWMNW